MERIKTSAGLEKSSTGEIATLTGIEGITPEQAIERSKSRLMPQFEAIDAAVLAERERCLHEWALAAKVENKLTYRQLSEEIAAAIRSGK